MCYADSIIIVCQNDIVSLCRQRAAGEGGRKIKMLFKAERTSHRYLRGEYDSKYYIEKIKVAKRNIIPPDVTESAFISTVRVAAAAE